MFRHSSAEPMTFSIEQSTTTGCGFVPAESHVTLHVNFAGRTEDPDILCNNILYLFRYFRYSVDDVPVEDVARPGHCADMTATLASDYRPFQYSHDGSGSFAITVPLKTIFAFCEEYRHPIPGRHRIDIATERNRHLFWNETALEPVDISIDRPVVSMWSEKCDDPKPMAITYTKRYVLCLATGCASNIIPLGLDSKTSSTIVARLRPPASCATINALQPSRRVAQARKEPVYVWDDFEAHHCGATLRCNIQTATDVAVLQLFKRKEYLHPDARALVWALPRE